MSFDPATLMTLTSLIAATVGTLLVFAWAQNRAHRALAQWGAADLGGALAMALLMTRNHAPDAISIALAIGVIAGAYGLTWTAARTFCHRRAHFVGIAAGPAVWFAACAFPAFFQSTELRMILISTISAAYTLAAAYELWRGRGERLLSRYPLVVCLVGHAALLTTRIGAALAWRLPDASHALTTPWLAAMSIEPMILVIACGFLQLSMAKERSELVHRRAAMTDALTGVANRRAFFDLGERSLRAATCRKLPIALLLFDLDRFKEINDGHGHQVGDCVLQGFSERIAEALRPGDLFGRIGGEEFAALLVDTTAERAAAIAERCRVAVRRMEAGPPGARIPLSVSIGIACAAGPHSSLEDLLRRADWALYEAKAAGRNCVRAAGFAAAELPDAA